jgi:sarcosine oxidase
VYFAAREPEDSWPSFGHLPATGNGIYGLATPGEGIKVGFHGIGPEVDPDHRDFIPEPGRLADLRDYARRRLPGVDPDTFTPISCTYTTTPDTNFVLDRRGPVVVATGFSGHGFKFVPAIGRVLADLAVDGARPDPRFAFER